MLKNVFTGMWSLEDYEKDKEVQDIVLKAIKDCHQFVLKPQKEGGGNNFYDANVTKLL